MIIINRSARACLCEEAAGPGLPLLLSQSGRDGARETNIFLLLRRDIFLDTLKVEKRHPLCHRSGLNPSSPLTDREFFALRVSLICRGMMVL